MRIRLERQVPILRVDYTLVDQDKYHDVDIVKPECPQVDVVSHTKIAVEVQHNGMNATRLLDFALETMNRMIEICEPVTAARKLVGDPEGVSDEGGEE